MFFGWLRPSVQMHLHPEFLAVRDLSSDKLLVEEPLVAVAYRPEERILGVGRAAKPHSFTVGVKLINPFKHPRTLVANTRLGEALIRGCLQRLYAERTFFPAPRVDLHPLVQPEGGFTSIELRALTAMTLGAGACQVRFSIEQPPDAETIARYLQAIRRTVT